MAYRPAWQVSRGRPIDLDVIAETALAMAQATLYNAMQEHNVKNADLARRLERPRSFITRILRGGHNLTIKTLAKALAACGVELTFEHVPLNWGWVHEDPKIITVESAVPALAGTALPLAA